MKFFKAPFFSYLLFLLGIMIPATVCSQFSSSVQYDITNGFVSNTTYYVLKDREGYLWITTDKGVVKYDGYNFNVFTTDDGLSDNEIFEAYQDSEGRIWFSAYNGIPCYYYKGQFHSFKTMLEKNNISKDGPTYKVLETPGCLWLLNRKNLYKYSGGELNRFSSGNANFITMSYDTVRHQMYILSMLRKKAWIIHDDNRVDSLILPEDPTTICKSIIKNDKLYYSGTTKMGIVDLKTNSSAIIDFKQEILCINDAMDEQNVLIGTAGCVYRYDYIKDSLFVKFEDKKNISCILPSYGYSYWCTSLNEGLSFTGNDNVHLLNDRNVLPFKFVFLVKKMKDKLLVASDNYRLCTYDLKKQKIISFYSGENNRAGRGLPSSIRSVENNNYIGFRNKLIKVLPDGSFREALINQIIYDFLDIGNYMVGLNLDKITRSKDFSKLIRKPFVYDSLFLTSRHLFYNSFSNTIYAYSNSGIYRIDADSFNAAHPFRDIPQLSTNISSINEISDSILIVGSTLNGLTFLRNNRWIGAISRKEGLSSNNVTCITVYKDEIWVGTDHGINVLHILDKTGHFSIFYLGKKDGISSNEINDIAIVNDTVYVGTPLGLLYFNKHKIQRWNEVPVMNIDYLKFGYKAVDNTRKNVLASIDNNLKVKFTGVSFSSVRNLVYRYKLAPVDVEWHYTNARELEYPSLKPGAYTLYIQCRGDQTEWSHMQTMEFVIQPAWYQRMGVKILIVLLLVISAALLINLRIRIINKQHALKEKLLQLEKEKLEVVRDQAIKEKEIIELEQQALRLHMNPHFVFNAINAIQGFYAGNEVGKAKQFISYFSKLLRLILETSREKLIPLSTEVEIIQHYLDLFLLRFENKYEYTLSFSDWDEEQFILIPPMIIQPFVENAVLHGISPLKAKGKIDISFVSNRNFLTVMITDNGIGRKRSGELKMKGSNKSTGITVTKMRLQNLHPNHPQEGNLEIIDMEENGEPVGTRVILYIPFITK